MNNKYENSLAVKEHLIEHKPLTRLEAIILYGVSNLTAQINALRKSGYIIEKRRVPYLVALRRVNELSTVIPPKELPLKEIFLTEYWININ